MCRQAHKKNHRHIRRGASQRVTRLWLDRSRDTRTNDRQPPSGTINFNSVTVGERSLTRWQQPIGRMAISEPLRRSMPGA